MSPQSPSLKLEEFFQGASQAHGFIEDRWGRVRRRFSADMTGQREGDCFILSEIFQFDDGQVQRRRWSVKLLSGSRYEASAEDVVGTALGKSDGAALRMRYRLRIEVGGRPLVVTMNDEMFLQPDGSVLNRARLTKWGLHLGTVLLTIRRKEQAQRLAAE